MSSGLLHACYQRYIRAQNEGCAALNSRETCVHDRGQDVQMEGWDQPWSRSGTFDGDPQTRSVRAYGLFTQRMEAW